jgi:phenylalanyl-tRNA synthetase alpha subunit
MRRASRGRLAEPVSWIEVMGASVLRGAIFTAADCDAAGAGAAVGAGCEDGEAWPFV